MVTEPETPNGAFSDPIAKTPWTAASRVTVFRTVLGGTAGCMLIFEGREPAAFMLLAAAAGLDLLDGFIARRYNQRTEFGALLDPIADKLVWSAALAAMAVRAASIIVWLLFLLGAVRDVALTAWRISVYRQTGKAPEAEISGKLKTAVQAVGVLGIVCYAACIDREFSFSTPAVTALYAVSVVLSWASWGRYLSARSAP